MGDWQSSMLMAWLLALGAQLSCYTPAQAANAECPMHSVRNVASLPFLGMPSCHTGAPSEALQNASTVRALAPLPALARGLQAFGDMRRMRRFVSKLLSGRNVTMSVAGGSISRGYGDSAEVEWESQGYFGRFAHWVQSTFSKTGQVVINGGGAIGAVMTPMYAACTSQMVPNTSDLVFIEFVVNDMYRWGGKDMSTEPRRLSYERLIRNVLAFPSQPAVVVVMVCQNSQEYWLSAENDMLVIAGHYQLPVISSRAAFRELMATGADGFRVGEQSSRGHGFYLDGVHPSHFGYRVMMELLANFLRQACSGPGHAVMDVVQRPLESEEQATIERGLDVPPPMFPGNRGREATSCLILDPLRAAAVAGSIDRFEWWDEGRNKWGWWTNSTQPGASITLSVNTAPEDAVVVPGQSVMLAFGCTRSGTQAMGIARVECVANCACEATDFDANGSDRNSMTALYAVHASTHTECHVKFQIQPGKDGSHLFKVSVAFVVDKVSNTTKVNDVLGHTNTKSLIDVERNARAPAQKFTRAENRGL